MTRRIVVATLAACLLAGLLLGLFTSKLLWGYFVYPQGIDLAQFAGSPMRLGSYEIDGSVVVHDTATRARKIDSELVHCKGQHTCSVGSLLRHYGIQASTGLEQPSSFEVSTALKKALQDSPVEFFREGAKGSGLYLRLDGGASLLTFHSKELSDDHYGYLEVGLNASAPGGVYSYHYLDVAGMEFLTPLMLVSLYTIALLILATLIALAQSWRRASAGAGPATRS